MLWEHTSSRQPSVINIRSSRSATGFKTIGLGVGLGAIVALSMTVTSVCAEPMSPLEQRGLELAQRHCTRCHIVSETDRFAGTSASPSFKIMIEYLKDWDDRFDTFMARNPHQAHIRLEDDEPRPEHLPATISEVVVSLADIEAIIAYVNRMATDLGHPRSE